jgi:methylenetetrahydrofolate reductase (NADPH)
MGRQELLLEVLPPLDWEMVGGEQVAGLVAQARKNGLGQVMSGFLSLDKEKMASTWDGIFRPVRQPEWWQGDAEYHAPQYSEPASNLERALKNGEFVVTAEIQPPQTVSTNKLGSNIDLLKPYVTALNFTDNASATPRMSSMACSTLTVQHGAEPVYQLTARDHNRVGLQADVLGSNALGIRNVLCLTGDSMKMGQGPRGRMDSFDLDSVQMLWILRRMRDEHRYFDGREIKFPPRYFLGAAASPFASEPKFQAIREHKKVNAGAQFFQTNVVFDADRLDIWLEELAKRNILDKVYILVGITPLKSLKMAKYMHDEVPGVVIPEAVLQRMSEADKAGKASEEGVQIALELIEQVRTRQGVHGIHIMAVGWEEIVPRIVTEAGLLPKAAAGSVNSEDIIKA